MAAGFNHSVDDLQGFRRLSSRLSRPRAGQHAANSRSAKQRRTHRL